MGILDCLDDPDPRGGVQIAGDSGGRRSGPEAALVVVEADLAVGTVDHPERTDRREAGMSVHVTSAARGAIPRTPNVNVRRGALWELVPDTDAKMGVRHGR